MIDQVPPHSRALVALAVVALGLLVAPSGAGSGAAAQGGLVAADRLETLVLREINTLRTARRLAPLRLSRALSAAAESHSLDMVVDGYFAHSSYVRRLRAHYHPRGYRVWFVGENLLWASPTISAPEALSIWLRSPAHRANLLNPAWREVGLAGVHAPTAPGYFRGREVTVLTVDFGVRR